MSSFDVVIIGSGPGGYVSAIRCAQLGFKTAVIEKYSTLGGTCLNVGCIPSKALLASSHHYDEIKHFADHGIELSGEVKVNLEKMIARKQAVVDQTSGGVQFLMDKNKITIFNGLGSFVDATHVEVAKADGTSETIEAKNIIMAAALDRMAAASKNPKRRNRKRGFPANIFKSVSCANSIKPSFIKCKPRNISRKPNNNILIR